MKKKIPETIGELFPEMEFKIRGSEESGYHRLLVKYSEQRMSVKNIMTEEILEFPGSLPISNVRDPRNK